MNVSLTNFPRSSALLLLAYTLMTALPVQAQNEDASKQIQQSVEDDGDASSQQEPAPEAQNAAEPERELTASELNARQRIKQTVTVRRSLNGAAIEKKSIDVPENLDLPTHPTEAGTSLSQIVRDQVDREVLTRREVLSEANLDFILADTDNDRTITGLEFSNLWTIRREDENYREVLTDENGDPYPEEAYQLRVASAMGKKFRLMAGMQSGLNRKEYITEVLRDFDSMDANGDYILRDLELLNFRRISVGMDTE